MSAFETYLVSQGFTQDELSVMSLLDQLSYSPLKFDTIWNSIDTVKALVTDYRAFADRLFANRDHDIFTRAATVFDDLTIFADLCPDAVVEPSIVKAPYVCMRPTAFRTMLDTPPSEPADPESVITQKLIVTARTMIRPDAVQPITGVLDDAAERYRRRGKSQGLDGCTLLSALIQRLADEGVLLDASVPLPARPAQPVVLAAEPRHPALHLEYVLHWPRSLEAVRAAFLPTEQSTDEDRGALGYATEVLENVARFLPSLDASPGAGTTIAALTLIRLELGVGEPNALRTCSPSWLHDAQSAINQARMIPEYVPGRFDQLHEYFVKVEYDRRN